MCSIPTLGGFVLSHDKFNMPDRCQRHCLQTKVMIALFGLFAEVEEGPHLGTYEGRTSCGKEEEIRILLQKQVSKASIAKIVGVSRTAMHHFINSRKLDPQASQPQSRTHRP